MSPLQSIRLLQQIATMYGVQTSYYDVNHRRRMASNESLMTVLRSLGAPVYSLKDVCSAWRDRHQTQWRQVIEPVIVDWDGESLPVEIHIPHNAADTKMNCHLYLENGESVRWDCEAANLQTSSMVDIEGTTYSVKHLLIPYQLPWGYHRFKLEFLGRQEESLIISSPYKTYKCSTKLNNRNFGVFLPLYALYSGNSWGSGDFSDLGNLVSWTAEQGGRVVATLPLLASFLDETYQPSPYLPVSKLLWNEFYLDVNSVPEIRECPSAQALMKSPSFQNGLKELWNSPLVKYREGMELKRDILKELCRHVFSRTNRRLEELNRFIKENPVVEDYAYFRAISEKQHIPWSSWPQPIREGVLKNSNCNEENKRYHLYVQWLAHNQMEKISERARENGVQLYLDLPLGVHPDGYDVWREREIFMLDTSAGAPQDTVYARGQNWGFPPLHPERIREQGYHYFIDCLRHHLRYAGILRIDHVMGLHRIFCIPNGMEASQGVYMRYRSDELYAILSLESHRHKAIIVGEDLGTVPSYVRPAMNKHGFQRMYVLQYELAEDSQTGLPPVSPNSVTSLNTHDMPPFSAFWQGLDIEERKKIGLIGVEGVKEEGKILADIKKSLLSFLGNNGWLKIKDKDISHVLNACLSFLAASQTQLLLINLEDLWLETQPQNIPSTSAEYSNWQRRARYSLEEFCQLSEVINTLRTINSLRKQRK